MIDTTIRFNDHNSYKITSILMGFPFGVQNMTHITHSFQAYATTALASATRARTKFLDADGATISDVSHSFAVAQVFGKVEITVAVPATAVQAQLVLIQGGTDWWIAEPKSEQGQVSTPYNVNYAGQLTYITPNGVYTGMMTTGQIVVTGSVGQPDETLDTRLVTINNNAINLSSTVSGLSSSVGDQETRLTTIEAGQITLSSRVGAVEPKVTKITSSGVYTGEVVATQITSGYISADRISAKSITGAKMADGTVGTLQIAASAITADKIAAGTITADKINVTNLYVGRIADLDNPNNYATFGTISGVLGVAQSYWSKFSADPRERLRIQLYGITATRITCLPYDGTGNNGTGSTIFDVGQNKAVLSCSDYMGRIEARYDGANNAVGVDATGPYYVKNGSKTYF